MMPLSLPPSPLPPTTPLNLNSVPSYPVLLVQCRSRSGERFLSAFPFGSALLSVLASPGHQRSARVPAVRASIRHASCRRPRVDSGRCFFKSVFSADLSAACAWSVG
eukprot:5288605-Pyramimonas_sp.AAC.1